jgi:Ca-activated chloride channel homolog
MKTLMLRLHRHLVPHGDALLLAAFATVGVTLIAQPAQPPPNQPTTSGGSFTFRSRAELINVTATVTDRDERFVAGLRKDDFALYEDGVRQAITHFSDERVPVSLGLVVDASGSMEGEKWTAARSAIGHFVNDLLGPEDEVFLSVFSDDVTRILSWTKDREAVSRALTGVRPGGGTSMYDAVADAIPIAQSGTRRKKALLVISDGNDRNSDTTIVALRQLIRETEVLIYAVGIDGESEAPPWTRGGGQRSPPRVPFPIPGQGPGPVRQPPVDWPGQPRYPRGGGGGGGFNADDRVNEGALREMTDDSGGRTEVIRSVRDLGSATANIADELSRQYSLGYPPAAARDGRWHSIRVDVRNRDYRVRARRGYVATP